MFNLKTVFLAVLLIFSQIARGLPINFGRNQGSLVYSELTTKSFYLYHDERFPNEALMIINSLERAKPVVEDWFKVKRTRPLPVIVSSVTGNASFANFITDAVELQTMGDGGRDLALHEYVHSSMYRHLDNWFGPAGSIIHLPWMPAWWIEGLAESLTVSIGSDIQSSIERHHALTGNWPSYDKLHSLYGTGKISDFAVEGYATSGAFVAYILRTYGADKVPMLLDDFFHYSMPWWWGVAIVPFNDFMPMDKAFQNYTGKTGRELYEEYKKAAGEYWTKHPDYKDMKPLVEMSARNIYYPANEGLVLKGDRLTNLVKVDGEIKEVEIPLLGEPEDFKTLSDVPAESNYPRVISREMKAFVSTNISNDLEDTEDISVYMKNISKKVKTIRRKGSVSRLFESRDRLLWTEKETEFTMLCFVDKKEITQKTPGRKTGITCPLKARLPDSLHYAGQKDEKSEDGSYLTSEIWFKETTETIHGEKHEIIRYFTDSGKFEKIRQKDGGKPLSIAITGDNEAWVLTADRRERFLRKIDFKGSCLEERRFLEFPARIFPYRDKKLIFSLEPDTGRMNLAVDPEKLAKRFCSMVESHISPIVYAFSHEGTSLHSALMNTSSWKEIPPEEANLRSDKISSAPPLSEEKTKESETLESRPSKWRGRPIFAFPWIGADSGGYNYGVLTVPIMDHMQNETVELSSQYGFESRFPSTKLQILTNRFSAAYTLSVFRYQTYNGSAEGQVMYYDEKGALILRKSSFPRWNMDMELGLLSSTLKPFTGPDAFVDEGRRGHQNEFQLNLSHSKSFQYLSLSSFFASRVVPEAINSTWEYNQLGGGTAISIPIKKSTLGLGISASRTRGKRTKFLKEAYRPLNTFIPGSGGGFNEINVNLIGPGQLTSATFGDTQARTKISWTYPIVEDLEKLIGIFYFNRLDFTAFFNYGSAWYGRTPPPWKDMVAAHGYNLDLQSDIKGVTVNAGLGTGQVLGHSFEIYGLFGFDALIN
ncbi:MAG: hypothetical protein HQK54_08095 [Oligoflexales bacterium]|nr:hypothetical protein [Oligoflexales bacterium]